MRNTATETLIRDAVEAVERARALHFVDDESPQSFRPADKDPLSPKDDKDAQRLRRTHEHSSPEWTAIRLSLSSSIHSLNISLSLLQLQDFHSPAERLVLRKKLVDDAKAAGRLAYHSALILYDDALN
ncbi:hypothetical protein AB4Z46_32785 [Variovorax sp. M-6]|uniref:hypothetical protein n=1 Tax=Variovorax sp. M-6 TaxID=3233041 RepID=UPI003F96A4FF